MAHIDIIDHTNNYFELCQQLWKEYCAFNPQNNVNDLELSDWRLLDLIAHCNVTLPRTRCSSSRHSSSMHFVNFPSFNGQLSMAEFTQADEFVRVNSTNTEEELFEPQISSEYGNDYSDLGLYFLLMARSSSSSSISSSR